jgi:siderophore synthetase component
LPISNRFVDVFFRAFLPSVLKNGVAFEAHGQNCVARFDLQTKEIKGFIIRDLGGIHVHPETLRTTTGIELEAAEGHSIIARDLDDVYGTMYHTAIHSHLQQLIRILELHYNGKGWAIVRKHLKAQIPSDHSLYESWMSPERKTFPGKCLMRMKMQGMYRFVSQCVLLVSILALISSLFQYTHKPFPNLIHYEGVSASC